MSNVTDWVSAAGSAGGALATTAAVIVALWLAGKQARETRKREDRQQAEHLTAWLFLDEDRREDGGPPTIGVKVLNSSDQAFYDVIAQLVFYSGRI